MRQCGRLRLRSYRAILVACCLFVAAAGEAFAQGMTTLPGGASSLRETYEDWVVACVQKEVRRCVLSQQHSQQNGQRVLAIQLMADADGQTATGALVLPFGLALDAGVTFQIDDKSAATPRRFSTCLPAGCIVPLSFDAATLAALRAGMILKATPRAADTNQPVEYSISLKGFSAAFDRVTMLMK